MGREDYKRTKLSAPERDDQNPILLKTETTINQNILQGARTVLISRLIFRHRISEKVWKALLDVPFGTTTTTYGELAKILEIIRACKSCRWGIK